MKKILTIFLLLIVPISAHAADESFSKDHGDFFRLMSPQHEDISASYTLERGVNEKHGPGEFDLDQFLFKGELAVPVNRDLYARLGGAYGARIYDFSASGSDDFEEKTLHRAEVLAGAGVFLSDDILLTGHATLGAYSDFESTLESEDWEIYGEGLMAFRLNPGAQLVMGARVSNDFEDTNVFPLIGFRMLSAGGKFHVSLTAPVDCRLAYNFDPSIQIYALATLAGEQYRVDAEGSNDRFDVFVQDRHFGLGLNWWVLSSLKLGIEAGVSAGSQLEFETPSASIFDGDLDPSGYFTANFGVAL